MTTRVLVTGGAGFVGQHLFKLFVDLGQIYASSYDLELGRNIFNTPQLHAAVRDCDIVVHLAGAASVPVSNVAPFDYYRLHVEGSARVFAAAARWDKKVIWASSWGVHRNDNPYAASKKAAESVAEMMVARGADIVTLRFSNLYGPGQPDGYVVPIFMRQARRGETLTVHPGQYRDFVYVDDVAEAIWAARDLGAGTVTEVGTNNFVSMGRVAEMIADLFPGTTVSTAGDTNRLNVAQHVSNSALLGVGWMPRTNLRTGLLRVKDFDDDNAR